MSGFSRGAKLKKNIYIAQFNPHEFRVLPLAAGLLAACVREDPVLNQAYRVQLKFQKVPDASFVAQLAEPAVLGFSTYIWNLQRSLRTAKLAKERFPDCVVIFGGPSVPRYDADVGDFLANHRFVDVLVHGEGELAFVELLHAIRGGADLRSVKGICFRSEDPRGYVRTPPRERIADLGAIPSPFLNGVFDEVLADYRDYFLERTGGMVLFETNRGCPFSCTFCDWGQAVQSRVNLFPEERVFRELDWMARNQVRFAYSCDANFGIKDRDLKIAQRLGRLHQETGYPLKFFVNWMKNSEEKSLRVADALWEAGVQTKVTLSMQSLDAATLKAVKRDNIDLGTYAALKRDYDRRGIPTYCELILGLPGETYDSFAAGLEKVTSPLLKDYFHLYPALIIPNTEMADPACRREFGIETSLLWVWEEAPEVAKDGPECYELIVGTKSMPTPDWRRAFCFGYLTGVFHNQRIAFHVLEFLKEHYSISLKDYMEFLIETVRASGQFPAMTRILRKLDGIADSILLSKGSRSSFEGVFKPLSMLETHCFLVAYFDDERFYDELERLTLAFLGGRREFDEALVREVCVFQRLVSPMSKESKTIQARFEHDLWAYFSGLCRGQAGGAIQKQETLLEFEPALKEKKRENAKAGGVVLSEMLQSVSMHELDALAPTIRALPLRVEESV